MKKYFVVETDEAIEFGDVINLTFFKEVEEGKVTIEKEIEFNEDTMDMLIEMGFVEEREEEEEGLIDFENECQAAIARLEKSLYALEERLGNLEGLYKELHAFCKSWEGKNTTSPKKK
jgi:hypothetical protein